MALSIRNGEAERLAREVAQETGESITQTIMTSLRERLERLTGSRRTAELTKEILKIGTRAALLPDLDTRSADDILGYGETGASG